MPLYDATRWRHMHACTDAARGSMEGQHTACISLDIIPYTKAICSQANSFRVFPAVCKILLCEGRDTSWVTSWNRIYKRLAMVFQDRGHYETPFRRRA